VLSAETTERLMLSGISGGVGLLVGLALGAWAEYRIQRRLRDARLLRPRATYACHGSE
jgi:hypothetical protein